LIYQQKEIRAHSTFHCGLKSLQQHRVEHQLVTGNKKQQERRKGRKHKRIKGKGEREMGRARKGEKEKSHDKKQNYRRYFYASKMVLREIGWDGVDCTDLAQDRDQWRALVNTVMTLRIP
jgi:hypothetical protein